IRNRVNCERKACRPKYFQAKVEHLKECKPSAWWNEIKKLSGCSPAFREKSYATKSLQHLYEPSDYITLANIINKAFSRPCLVSHRSLLITSYFQLTAQPYNLRLLYQTIFHHSFPQYLSNEMERLQKRALRIIQLDLSYDEALVALDITSLYESRKALSNALFDQIVRDQSHKLHDLLP
ncbi:unnamed protein product, partial [Porites evermanni]